MIENSDLLAVHRQSGRLVGTWMRRSNRQVHEEGRYLAVHSCGAQQGDGFYNSTASLDHWKQKGNARNCLDEGESWWCLQWGGN